MDITLIILMGCIVGGITLIGVCGIRTILKHVKEI